MTPSPTTPTPPCAECGPFTIRNAERHDDIRASGAPKDYIVLWVQQYGTDGKFDFPCQRCGTVHVLRGGKLEREEKPMKYKKVGEYVNGEWMVKLLSTGEVKPASHWHDISTENTIQESHQPQTESEVKQCATQPPYAQAIHSIVNAISVPVASPAPVQSKPESGATPVRYNVTRFGEMHNEPDVLLGEHRADYLTRKIKDLSARRADSVPRKLVEEALIEIQTEIALVAHKFERAGGIWKIASSGVELGQNSWASNVENGLNNATRIVAAALAAITKAENTP